MQTTPLRALVLALPLMLGACASNPEGSTDYTAVSANAFVAANYRAADALTLRPIVQPSFERSFQQIVREALADLDLEQVRQSGRDLLESIVLPSATIAQGYVPFLVSTTDGRATTGVITRQTNEVLFLRDSSGADLRFRKETIEDFARTNNSIMPEGLDRVVSNVELRDLLAFLQALK